MARFVKHAGKLLLQVARKNRVSDRETNDREVLSPWPLGSCAAELAVERLEPLSDPFAASVLGPTRRLLFERLPVLVALVFVPDLRCVDDPRQGMLVYRLEPSDVGS